MGSMVGNREYTMSGAAARTGSLDEKDRRKLYKK